MRTNAILFWSLCLFFGILAVVYPLWSLIYAAQGLATVPAGAQGGAVEWAGTIGLSLTSVLSGLIGFYVQRVHKAQGGELPEDRLDANIDDGDAEQGFFSPWSWWPLMLGGSAALLFLGIAVGTWVIFIAVALTAVSLVGWTYEYYRGNFGR